MLSSAAAMLADSLQPYLESSTFNQLSPVDLAGCDLESDNVALSVVSVWILSTKAVYVQLPH